MLEGSRRVLILGCGTCVTVCMAGGEKEVAILASTLRLANQKDGRRMDIAEATIERQCDREFFDAVRDKVAEADVVLSLACGVGVQFFGEVFPDKAVLPGLDTKFYGATIEPGRVGRALLGLRHLRDRRLRRCVPRDPLLEEPSQRPLRRLAERQVRGGPRDHRLRLAAHLRQDEGPRAAATGWKP